MYGIYLPQQATSIVKYRWRVAKILNFILQFYVYLHKNIRRKTMRMSKIEFSQLTAQISSYHKVSFGHDVVLSRR